MSFAPTLEQAIAHLNQGDFSGAGRIAETILASRPSDADALHLLALVRAQEQRFAEAVGLLQRSLKIAPRQPQAQANLGKALAQLGRSDEAAAALRAAIKLKPDFLEALFELGKLLHATGDWEGAENAWRKALRLRPVDPGLKLALGRSLMAAKKFTEAESVLDRGIGETGDASLKSRLAAELARTRMALGRKEDALAAFETASQAMPAMQGVKLERAELLHDMRRFDEALALYRELLAREPHNLALHHDYNDLLYRLERWDDYLKSYDRAPHAPQLQLAKAGFLMHGNRHQEAHDVFAALLKRDANDKHAGAGLATSLSRLGRHDEAAAHFETLIARHPADTNLLANATASYLIAGDAARALALSEAGTALAPDNQMLLALKGTALRLMGDERDEILNGYDGLIRIFDLEAPEGFSGMVAFNQELNAYLDRLHPQTREHVFQSLRGGSQTIAEMFGQDHELIDRLQQRISQAVARYVAELKTDENHPFLSRRRENFSYAGSWSSRLADQGFHANHLHPGGWISSCYYVAVPEAVKDERQRQGWIKFGEPDIAVALKEPVRRAIQPVPGRLVLFPSYMWHGTIAFHDAAARTTIAFDAVPA